MDKADVGKFVHVRPEGKEPYPRSGHCCATDGNNLFVYGGYHPECHTSGSEPGQTVIIENQLFAEMWCFNLSTETWHEVSTVGDKPTSTASMSMILDTMGHMLLFYGGTGHPWGERINKDLMAFVLREKRWKPLTCTGDVPAAKYGQAIVLRQGRLYCFGGCRRLPNGEDLLFNSELHCLDLQSRRWSLLYDNPQDSSRVMYRHGLVVYRNKLYVIGSSYRDLYSLSHWEKIHVFDMDTNEWDIDSTLPCPCDGFPRQRKYHSCVQWENEVYVCGGHNNRVVLRDIWKLELPSLQWSRLQTDMPVTTYFHSAAITHTKCMYTFGGITDLEERPRSNAVFRIWLAVPSLLDLALKKVLSLMPSRNDQNIAHLQDLGVPPNIMDKLRHLK